MKLKWFLRVLGLIALVVVIYLFIPLLKELGRVANLFKYADWIWLAVALLIQVISYSFLTWLNLLALQPFPGSIKFTTMMGSLSAIAFIETAFPTAGASGVILRAHLLSKHGQYKVEASTFTLAVEAVFIGLAMATVALLGFIFLFKTGKLTQKDIIQLAFTSLAAFVLIILSWRALQSESFTRKAVYKTASWWNRFTVFLNTRFAGRVRLPAVTDTAIDSRLENFHASVASMRVVPLWKFLLACYGRILLDVATLGVCFRMFHYAIAPSALFTGYGLILAFSGVAALPGGLGMADLSIPIIFSRLGVPGPAAIAAGLTYRLVAFWLLRFIGFINWQLLEVRS